MIGQTISHYQILDKLGEGGMGVVYKARDTKLDRDVALKFLPPHLAASDQDKARFVQEAKAAAALNHPNVCSIIDIQEYETQGGGGKQMFIVMEYVDGQTLRAKMPSINPGKAIDIGIQIAEGLSAAHEKGIVHRDIKPENIMVRKDGIAQIMDFGLAKLRGSGSKITRLTKEGSTVGTAGYMSPEQVQGQDADHRSDIFSLGVLLYELFTGELPFKGVHETALMYEIVNVDPAPLSAVRQDLDPELDRIVLECLQKDPDERYNSVKDIAKDLKRFKRESSRARVSRITAARPVMRGSGTGPASGAGGRSGAGEGSGDAGVPEAAAAPSRRREIIAWSVAAVLLAIAGYLMSRPSPMIPVAKILLRSSIVTPDSIYIHSFGAGLGPPVISPDGRAIAFSGVRPDGAKRIYVRMLNEMEVRALPGTGGGNEPFWSPDGKYVGYFDGGGRMRKIDPAGGSPTTIASVPNPRGGTWNSDGTIVFAPDYQSGLFRVSADGKGEPVQITTLDSSRNEGSHRWPFFLPDGKHFLYLARAAAETGEAEGDAVFVASLDGSTKKMVVQSSFNPSFADGYLLFARSSVLMAQRFNLESLTLEGDAVKLQDGVLTDLSYNMAVYTVSNTGTLLYQTGKAEAGARPMFVDRSGAVTRLIDDRGEQDHPRLSPDGTQLAVYFFDTRSRRSNIWVYDLRTGGRRRLTTRPAGDFYPVWSADGSRIFFVSGGVSNADIYEQPVARSGGEKFFAKFATQERVLDCSPDGKTLLIETTSPSAGKGDLWLVPATGDDRTPTPFQQTKFDEHDGRISRDGRWVAYVSDESGGDEIYVKRFSAPGSDAWKVSSSGGNVPLWGPGTDELIYVNSGNEVVAATLRFSGDAGEVVVVKPLFNLPPFTFNYDIAPDGKTFVLTRSLEMQKFPPLSLLVNWDEILNTK